MPKLCFFVLVLFSWACAPKSTETDSPPSSPTGPKGELNPDRLLGAYYFGAGYFTLVPDNVRKDMDEMKSWGTDLICIGITENDMRYNAENITFIINEAHMRKMKVFAVPSRMAGITAGQPVEPPLFGYHHPHTATLRKDGSPIVRKHHGILSSFYHPEVKDYFITLTSRMVQEWELDGIVWDEPKSTYEEWQDFSPLALKNNPQAEFTTYLKDFAQFISDLNSALKKVRPDLTIVYFDEACRSDTVIEQSAKIEGLDYFGADGKPYPLTKTTNITNRDKKVLPKFGERFLKAARANGLKTMMLIENQRIGGKSFDKMEAAFPYILEMDIDLLLYYYYGFYREDTERGMDIIRRFVPQFKYSGHTRS